MLENDLFLNPVANWIIYKLILLLLNGFNCLEFITIYLLSIMINIIMFYYDTLD